MPKADMAQKSPLRCPIPQGLNRKPFIGVNMRPRSEALKLNFPMVLPIQQMSGMAMTTCHCAWPNCKNETFPWHSACSA